MHFANIITLTTDFGLDDPFVGQVKGAILKRNLSVRIIDICHAIPPHDILTAAVTIRTSYTYFPKGSIHLIVVDPGVGSRRNTLAAASEDHLFIAPDNGTLSLLFKDKIIQSVYRVENPALFPSEISATFHGRDIMAPVAAALAEGMTIDQVGPATTIASCNQLRIPEPIFSETSIEGQILHIDHFGNIRTNITSADLSRIQPTRFKGIRIKGRQVNAISTTYSDCPPGDMVAVIDSAGYLEIAVNKGNAALFTKSRIGDQILVLTEHE